MDKHRSLRRSGSLDDTRLFQGRDTGKNLDSRQVTDLQSLTRPRAVWTIHGASKGTSSRLQWRLWRRWSTQAILICCSYRSQLLGRASRSIVTQPWVVLRRQLRASRILSSVLRLSWKIRPRWEVLMRSITRPMLEARASRVSACIGREGTRLIVWRRRTSDSRYSLREHRSRQRGPKRVTIILCSLISALMGNSGGSRLRWTGSCLKTMWNR